MKKFTKRDPLKSIKAGKLIEQIPTSLLEELATDYKVDHQVSRLYGSLVVKLLLFAMLRSERLSTRVLEKIYNSMSFKYFSRSGGHRTRHSSLADRLSKLNYKYFEAIYEWMAGHYEKHLKIRPKWLENLQRFDSTLIAIGGGLVDWGMRVGPKPKEGLPKVQLKVTLGLRGLLPCSVKAFMNQEDLSEQTALAKAIVGATHRAGDFMAFDQGLSKRATLQQLDQKGLFFITRCKANVRYEYLETFKNIQGRLADGLRFVQDIKVNLYGSAEQLLDHPFRLIEVDVLDGEAGKESKLYFLTNIYEMSAMDIARAYRRRWDIEVFFRFLKQELNLKHLINRTPNGIMIQIYSALMAAILIVTFKKINKIEGYKIAKIQFEDELFEEWLLELSKFKPPQEFIKRWTSS